MFKRTRYTLICVLAASCGTAPSASDLLAELSPYIQLELALVHTHPSTEAGAPPERLLARASAVIAELKTRPDAEARHAMLALDLALRPGDAAIVERVVAGLERLHEARPQDLELQNDLAVAYAARAATARRSDGIFRALDLIAEAAQSEHAPPETLRNRTALLRRLGVIADSTPTGTDAGRTRELVLDSLLPAWARGSDTDALLAQSRALAASLDGRLDGVIDAAARGGAAIRRAHVEYGAARRAYRTGNFVHARTLFREAHQAARSADSPLQWWAEIYALATEVQTSGEPEPLLRLERAAQALPLRLNALRGVAYSTLALASGRRGMLAEAIVYDAQAITCFLATGELGNAAGARLLDTEIHWILGHDRAAIEKLLLVFTDFRGERSSITFLNLLLVGAGILQDAGLSHAALSVLAEARRVALETGRELDPPSADLRFARVLQTTGRAQEAAAILENAGKHAGMIADTLMRLRLATEIAEVRASVMPPDSAIDALDRVVDYYALQNFSAGEVRALVARGQQLQERGAVTAAVRDFERALNEVERSRDAITNAGLRATLTSSVRPALDRLLAMALDRGDTLGGLRLAARMNGTTLNALPRLSNAECTAAIVLALLPDRVATWVITPDALHLRTNQVARGDIQRTVRALHAALRQPGADSSAHEALRVLGNTVIGPVEDLIRNCGRLAIVADRELHHVPFAALHIPGNGRFLIEDYVIQVVPSLRWLEPETSPRPPSHALLVGVTSPAPDYPELPPLEGATAEVAAIAQHYGSPTVLADDAASPERLLAEIQHHDVLHFAGHALTPARRPDLAHLVLARSTIPIEQLRRLDLARLQLAVLASCSTLGDFSADSQGFESLARAFLDAGARGVVGTLWEIEDQNAQALLTDFHRLVATGTEPASALRKAQLKIINGQRGRNADVAQWAGYRYEGR